MFNQDLVMIIKEIRDTFDGIDLELELINQSILNVLKTLEDSLSAYSSEDVVRLANAVIKKTSVIRHWLDLVDESADFLIKSTDKKRD